MYNLFTDHYMSTSPVTKPPGFDLVKRIYQREIQTIQNYYNNRVFAVQGNHLLCNILNMARVPIQYEMNQFMEIVQARTPYVAKHFRLTSAIEYGVFHEGVFYGPGNKELIFSDESYFNPFEAVNNWKTLKPIKVLSHQISDFGLLLPDGKANSSKSGFCSVSINIPMLICMYRGFLTQQLAKIKDGTQSLLGVTHFVHMYVLPSMLNSHIDIVLMNRLSNLFRETEMSISLKKHAFQVVDYGQRVDVIFKELLGRLEGNRGTYYAYLQNIPSIFHEDMLASLKMPDFSRTRQVWWALNISRFEISGLLMSVGGDTGRASNTQLMNDLNKACRYLSRENMLRAILPPDLYVDVSLFVEEVLTL